MRIEYKGSLLEQILERHRFTPIDFVHLNKEEFREVESEALSHNIFDDGNEKWFKVRCCEIVFYLEVDG